MAKLELFAPILFKWEGGFQCDKDDSGNYNSKLELVGTKFGVSAKAYEDYYGEIPTKETMQNLTPEKASFVLKKYWNNCKADLIENQSIANLVVDFHYNSGFAAIKAIQKSLNVYPDGIIGKLTLEAINNNIPEDVFVTIWNVRKEFYLNIVKRVPKQAKFLKGWLNRLDDFKFEP